MNLPTSECCKKIDFRVEEQIVVLSLEARMWFLFDFELNISREHPGHLVSFASEINFVASLDTFVDMNMKDLALDDGLFPCATFASIFIPDDFALSLAVGADGLKTLDHGSHLVASSSSYRRRCIHCRFSLRPPFHHGRRTQGR